MGVRLYREPPLKKPVLFCGWPGIGNIGIIAIDTLRGVLRAQQFGEIEPWEFFYPHKVVIQDGLLKDLQFPRNKFYFRHLKSQDVIFFVGEQQTSEAAHYAEGQKAYQLANLVLDVAEQFGCRRVYTSGAAVTQIHHTSRPRVWAVPNSSALIEEIRGYDNTVLMSQIERRSGHGSISGLNGLMLGAAKRRGFEAICLMGEIPYYLQASPWPYPKASKAVLEVLARNLGLDLGFAKMDELARTVEQSIEDFLERLQSAEGIASEVVEQIDRLKEAEHARLGPITEEEQKRIMEHIDELFNQERGK